jgi:acetylglutamate kinase
MRGLTVIKVGGNEVDDSDWTARLALEIAMTAGGTLIVHGGGKEVSDVQRTLGAEPEWRDGLRITTPQALRAVSMVLSGLVNKRLVAAIITAGAEAAGISGEDNGTLLAKPIRDGILGRTGEIVEVRPRLLMTLLENGITPVLSPVSRALDGGALNVNADDASSAVASAVGATRFLMVSNVPGVLKDGAAIPEVSNTELEELIAAGVASGGMIPKLRAAMRAAAAGVNEVRIGDLGILNGTTEGTRIIA